jgi:hypothetical protein
MVTTYEELKEKTVAELREIAKGLNHDAVHGFSQMNKEHLLPAICTALGIDMHEHHHAVVGIDKGTLKAQIRALKTQRDQALEAHDTGRLSVIRRQMHHLNHQIRSHTV